MTRNRRPAAAICEHLRGLRYSATARIGTSPCGRARVSMRERSQMSIAICARQPGVYRRCPPLLRLLCVEKCGGRPRSRRSCVMLHHLRGLSSVALIMTAAVGVSTPPSTAHCQIAQRRPNCTRARVHGGCDQRHCRCNAAFAAAHGAVRRDLRFAGAGARLWHRRRRHSRRASALAASSSPTANAGVR